MAVLAKWFTTPGSASYLYSRVYAALYRRRPETFNYDAEDYLSDIEDAIGDCEWGEFYAICEAADSAIVPLYFDDYELTRRLLWEDLNEVFEVEGAPWQMKDGEIVSNFPEDAQRILDEAGEAAKELGAQGVAIHLEKARRYLVPSHLDPENAVKEAVSAVEAAVEEKTGVDDLNEGLKLLKQQRRLKPHWSSPIQTLFHYASEEDQVRHGSPEPSELTYEEARDLVGLAAVLTQHIAGLPSPVKVE